ncbi:MAG: ATP-binding response regulator [Bacillota bacterium]
METNKKEVVKNISEKYINSDNPVYFIDNEFNVLFANKVIKDNVDISLNNKCFRVFHNRDKPCKKCSYEKAKLNSDVSQIKINNFKSNYNKNNKDILQIALPCSQKDCNFHIIIEFDNLEETFKIEQKNNIIEGLNEKIKILEDIQREKDFYYTNSLHKIQRREKNTKDLVKFLKAQKVFDSYKESIEMLEKLSINSINDMNKILFFNKINEIKPTKKDEKFDIIGFFNSIKKEYTILSKNRNISFNTNISTKLDDKYIGDQDKIRQIIKNILDNAFDFTFNGSIILDVILINKGIDRSIIKIIIKDTGIGIPEEKINYITKRFTKLDNKSNLFDKVGLGLSISKKLIELLNGTLHIQSKLQNGTTVSIDLPLKNVNSNIEKTTVQKESKIKVLFVGINDIFDYFLKFKFKEDFIFKKAKDGQEGLVLYYEINPDIVIVDIMSEKVNGFNFLDTIESNEKKDVPIVATSDEIFRNESNYLKSYGFDDYISKPIDYKKLKDVINKNIKE